MAHAKMALAREVLEHLLDLPEGVAIRDIVRTPTPGEVPAGWYWDLILEGDDRHFGGEERVEAIYSQSTNGTVTLLELSHPTRRRNGAVS